MRILILAVMFLVSSVVCDHVTAEIPANYQPLIDVFRKMALVLIFCPGSLRTNEPNHS